MSSSSKGAFKICFNNQIHKVVSLPSDLKAFKTLVTYFFGLQLPTEWSLQYVDEDGDVITLANDFDYKAFLELKSARVNVVPMMAQSSSVSVPEKTQTVEENPDCYSESGQSEAISFLTAGDFGFSEEPRKNSHKTLSQMRNKQRQRALRVVDNLKRHDLSKAKKENLKTQLEEINETIVLLKQKQLQAEATPQESVLIVEKPQAKESGATLYEVEFPVIASQEKASFSSTKKQSANRKRAHIKRDLKNVSYQDDFEEIDNEGEEEYEYEFRPVLAANKASISVEEKARKIKEIFSHIDVEILSFFLRENPQLKIEDVIQNYITA